VDQVAGEPKFHRKQSSVAHSWEREKPFLLVRADGMLCWGNHQTLASSLQQSDPAMHLMRYPGSIKDPQEKIQAFLDGMSNPEHAAYNMAAVRGDITNMTRDELVLYAMDEYGLDCEDRKLYPAVKIRELIEHEREEIAERQAAKVAAKAETPVPVTPAPVLAAAKAKGAQGARGIGA
jgi:hypothetical protein